MKTIIEPYEKVKAVLYTKYPGSENGWRPAQWVVPYSAEGVYLMKNTFSGEVVHLTEEEFSAPESVEELKKRRFVVPEDYNEAEQYTQTIRLIKLMQRETPGLKTYTILPTTACNARCTYCYEEGFDIITMTPETVERLIDFICETRQEDKIHITWFGGEPLVCSKAIGHVSRTLEERGVPFKATVVTNASLFTPELVREAKEVWKTEIVQVSLDGEKSDYTARKRFIDPVRYNYETVMRSIQLLAEADIKVQLRVNFDRSSLPKMQSFLDEIKERFGKYPNVKMYLYMLFQQQHMGNCVDVYREMFDLYGRNKGNDMLMVANSKGKLKLNMCMADSLDKSIVIGPDGKLYECENLSRNNSWGNIFDGVTDEEKLKQLKEPAKVEPECADCPYLPECTPFFRRRCPDHFEYCREYNELKTEYALRGIAEKELEND